MAPTLKTFCPEGGRTDVIHPSTSSPEKHSSCSRTWWPSVKHTRVFKGDSPPSFHANKDPVIGTFRFHLPVVLPSQSYSPIRSLTHCLSSNHCAARTSVTESLHSVAVKCLCHTHMYTLLCFWCKLLNDWSVSAFNSDYAPFWGAH